MEGHEIIHIPVEELGDSCTKCGTEAKDGDKWFLLYGKIYCPECGTEEREIEVEMHVRSLLDRAGLQHIEISKVERITNDNRISR